MKKTIKRAPPARRPVQAGKPRKPRAKKVSTIDRMLLILPVSEATLKRVATFVVLASICGMTLGIAAFFGVPQAAGVLVAEEIGRAGFRVQSVELTGIKRMNQMKVYDVVFDKQSRAMPLVDLQEVRQRLLKLGWVADAQVSRRLPNRLVVNIIEREPAAVWQHGGVLTLVDGQGKLLDTVSPDAIPPLPRIVGAEGNLQVAALGDLLNAAPSLKPLVRTASWVEKRRWDLIMASGETLVLPEEDPGATLAGFARKDNLQALLGRGWVRFDLRDPARWMARRPDREMRRAITDPLSDRHAMATAPLAAVPLTNTDPTNTAPRDAEG